MEDKVINALKAAGQPLKSAQIAEMTGLDKKDVDKLIKKLKTADRIYCPKNCFYDIKG
jgi:chromosome segregation and condensation protein ScpB